MIALHKEYRKIHRSSSGTGRILPTRKSEREREGTHVSRFIHGVTPMI